MRRLALLVEELEVRTGDADRVASLVRYLAATTPADAACAGGWLVDGGRAARGALPRLHGPALAAAVAARSAAAGLPDWAFAAGRAACDELADALALLLPDPPADAAGPTPAAGRAGPAAWFAAWRDLLSAGPTPAPAPAGDGDVAPGAAPAGVGDTWQGISADERAAALRSAACIAALPDPPTRRFAIRALLGLQRPLVARWQWLRAQAAQRGQEPSRLAWQAHVGPADAALAPWRVSARPPADGARRPGARRPDAAAAAGAMADWPAPGPWPLLAPAPADAGAALAEALCAGRAWVEAHWPGQRVQIVRRGAALALWADDGALLNDRLPAWLTAVQAWPDGARLEGVLFGWADGQAVDPPWRAGGGRPAARGPTLHLALTDLHCADGAGGPAAGPAPARPAARHAALRALAWPLWPADPATPSAVAAAFDRGGSAEGPPPVFVNAPLSPRAGSALLDPASGPPTPGARGRLWRAADLDGADGPTQSASPAGAWLLPHPPRRVRAVLSTAPSALLAAGADPAALAAAGFGFALWDRAPASAGEAAAALASAAAGAPADASGPRLLPFARLPLVLPADELQRIHAWLRAQAVQRFGPVSLLPPALVFELAFTRLRASRRHKLGLVPEGVRLVGWCEGATLAEVGAAAALVAAPPST